MFEPPARIGLVGLHGHGGWHLRNVTRLAAQQRAELVGVCDFRPPGEALAPLVGSVPWTDDLDLLLATEPDIVILCTPMHTHVELAKRVAASGVHLLLEKPTAPSMAGFTQIVAATEAAGVACQVGYQAMGSSVPEAIAAAVARGDIGEPTGVGGAGVAVRLPSYYHRSDWAGQRRLPAPDGSGTAIDVVDGVLTNPFIHAVAGALRIADGERAGAILATEAELHRANPIEADDTSVVRVVLDNGRTIVVAGTTCAEKQHEPYLVVHGSAGRLVWPYKGHQLLIEQLTEGLGSSGPRVDERIDRRSESVRLLETGRGIDLLDNLIEHLHRREPLVVPLASTRAVTEVIDAIRLAPDPAVIDDEYLDWVVADDGAATGPDQAEGRLRRPIVDDIGALVRRAADRLATFSELGAPWARSAAGASPTTDPDAVTYLGALQANGSVGSVVADYQLAPAVSAELAPRPFLHPVRTAAGTVVTDERPADHRWHLGVGWAIQDVDRANIWGGRTYVTDMGYTWLDDHGTIRHLADLGTDQVQSTLPGGVPSVPRWSLAHRLGWFDRNRRCLLTEDRTVTAIAVGPDRWALGIATALRNATGRTIELGSPGSNGRKGGGYGGFFWRLPVADGTTTVRTEAGEGEEAVHGTQAPWLAISGGVDGSAFTLLASPADHEDNTDRWFVRAAGYPGFGLAIAWDKPVVLEPRAVLRREVRVLVADGAWGSAGIGTDGAHLAAQLRRSFLSPNDGLDSSDHAQSQTTLPA